MNTGVGGGPPGRRSASASVVASPCVGGWTGAESAHTAPASSSVSATCSSSRPGAPAGGATTTAGGAA